MYFYHIKKKYSYSKKYYENIMFKKIQVTLPIENANEILNNNNYLFTCII